MTTTIATESDRAEWQARDATPTEALNAWTERAAKLEAENAKLRRERREPQPVTLDDAYAAIRKTVEENKRLSAEVKELRRGPAGTIAEAIDLIRDQARDSEGVIDTVRRLIESQARPASPHMLAAIQEQAREGETPDQTVERLIRERRFLESQHDLFKRASDIDGEILDAIRAALGTPEDVDVTEHARAVAADLRRTEHDLARLIRFARGVWTMPELKKLVDDIADRGAPGWLERALSDETAEPVRQERAAWEARVSEAVQEGERRIDAIDRQHAALLATIQTAIPAIRAGINALGSSEEDVRQRNAARDSLHALEAAVEGQEPAAVLSAADAEAVRALRRWRELTITEGGAHLGEWADVLIAIDKVIEAGRPLASEGKEG